jgi:hypothetical protein
MSETPMSVDVALARLRQYWERPASTWSTASYGASAAEGALAGIARVLAAEVERMRDEHAAEGVEYAIRRADGAVLDPRTGHGVPRVDEVVRAETVGRLFRYRDSWPDAVMVQRSVAYGPWTPVADACCHLHRPDGCCDPQDCGPCCEHCPTCPTLARGRVAEGEMGGAR